MPSSVKKIRKKIPLRNDILRNQIKRILTFGIRQSFWNRRSTNYCNPCSVSIIAFKVLTLEWSNIDHRKKRKKKTE